MADAGDYDALVALGCVIRGETYHFELVANESGAGVMRVSLDHQVPIANAILTVDTEEQAWARAETRAATPRAWPSRWPTAGRPFVTETPRRRKRATRRRPPFRARTGAAGPVPVAGRRHRLRCRQTPYMRETTRVRSCDRDKHLRRLLQGCIEDRGTGRPRAPHRPPHRPAVAGGACVRC